MAGEIQAQHVTGSVLYAVLVNAVGAVWNGSAFDATPTTAEWTSYDIALSEDSTTGQYRGPMPAVAAGRYSYRVYKRLGGAGTELPTDPMVWAGEGDWSGTAWVYQSGDVFGAGTSAEAIAAALVGIGAFVSSPSQSPPVGSLGTFIIGTTWIMPAISVGSLPADREKLWWTVKTVPGLDDSAAILMVEETDGLLVLNGAAVVVPNNAAAQIVYDDGDDTVTPRVETDATEVVAPHGVLYFDVKYRAAGSTAAHQVAAGTLGVVWGITNAT